MVMTVHGSVAEQSVETPYPDSPWVVMKFGGRSVATAENWAKIAGLVQARLDEGVVPVIVHSALAGVSNALIDLLETAERGDAVDEKLDKLKRQHFDLAADLGVDGHMLDELFEKQVRAGTKEERIKYLRAFEQRVLEQAYTVPTIWWHRIVVTWKQLKGWHMSPSHYLNQDLTDVWLDQ